ncbi:hypothetical protein K438DRAFT_2006845 [Mycena galopus ATCC 62051]|nr:hypothetical protein K438DRAFT_2006845 [Mycena galopus ATCC 62051]
MPTANNIPDEIISEILSPALRVPDAAFSALSFTGDSPFVRFSESSSAYLMVSKAWLRVATPLLYNICIIRSKAQAQALATTLTANPALGQFIKKLRVEGGYAMSMLKILQASKNITDLFLSLDIIPSDNASGLCRGLPLVNPVRVILHTEGATKNAQKLLDALRKCIPTWKQLAQFETQYAYHVYGLDILNTTFTALSQAPNLTRVVLWDHHDIRARMVPWTYMRTVAANPALKHIQIKPAVSPQQMRSHLRTTLYAKMKADPQLEGLLDITEMLQLTPDEVPDSPVEPSSMFEYPARLAANPVQEDSIWSHILYFALESHASEDKWPLVRHRDSQFSRLAPLLVCKMFARLGTPHLYENVKLKDVWAAQSFAAQLARHPLLGRCVRFLFLNHGGDTALFKSTIAHTPALTSLHGGRDCLPITWKAFGDLGESTGSTLRSYRGIRISKPSGAVSPAVFAQFPQIEEFHWLSTAVFNTDLELITAATFSLLVDLTVSSFDGSFLEVLALMELPSLRTVVFTAIASGGASFFRKHGTKLRELTVSEHQIRDPENAIWLNCSSLTVLGVSCDEYVGVTLSAAHLLTKLQHPASASCLTTLETHAHLERIVFKITEHYRLKQPHRTQLNLLMTSLRTTTSFPTLREVEHPLCKWPTTERGTLNSHWVKWAEKMLERGARLVGPDGVHWRRRLKFVPKKKQQ